MASSYNRNNISTLSPGFATSPRLGASSDFADAAPANLSSGTSPLGYGRPVSRGRGVSPLPRSPRGIIAGGICVGARTPTVLSHVDARANIANVPGAGGARAGSPRASPVATEGSALSVSGMSPASPRLRPSPAPLPTLSYTDILPPRENFSPQRQRAGSPAGALVRGASGLLQRSAGPKPARAGGASADTDALAAHLQASSPARWNIVPPAEMERGERGQGASGAAANAAAMAAAAAEQSQALRASALRRSAERRPVVEPLALRDVVEGAGSTGRPTSPPRTPLASWIDQQVRRPPGVFNAIFAAFAPDLHPSCNLLQSRVGCQRLCAKAERCLTQQAVLLRRWPRSGWWRRAC